ncbi:hypothetical protein K458DRAFT_396294 [Lentithecium fluviatile CBS 122367]|uniref:Uncharacterized protein n=1 Tax=Lentithecium fluviatile CBS 122367 TaxID=1168545 RepID=A0A6G1IGC4_9PLEO|nr:hypothetical protein K458DRAFT_396294 [Lentithecium fluviatile CBS 122367]
MYVIVVQAWMTRGEVIHEPRAEGGPGETIDSNASVRVRSLCEYGAMPSEQCGRKDPMEKASWSDWGKLIFGQCTSKGSCVAEGRTRLCILDPWRSQTVGYWFGPGETLCALLWYSGAIQQLNEEALNRKSPYSVDSHLQFVFTIFRPPSKIVMADPRSDHSKSRAWQLYFSTKDVAADIPQNDRPGLSFRESRPLRLQSREDLEPPRQRQKSFTSTRRPTANPMLHESGPENRKQSRSVVS